MQDIASDGLTLLRECLDAPVQVVVEHSAIDAGDLRFRTHVVLGAQELVAAQDAPLLHSLCPRRLVALINLLLHPLQVLVRHVPEGVSQDVLARAYLREQVQQFLMTSLNGDVVVFGLQRLPEEPLLQLQVLSEVPRAVLDITAQVDGEPVSTDAR